MEKYIVKEASIEVGSKKASIESDCTIELMILPSRNRGIRHIYEDALKKLSKHESSI